MEDFLARRTRLAYVNTRDALAAASRVAELMGEELQWGADRRSQEVRKLQAYLHVSFAAAASPK